MLLCLLLHTADEEEDNEEVAGSLVDALVEANTLELLVERLVKLNESVDEEATAVNNALAVIEHAVEVGWRPWWLQRLVAHSTLWARGWDCDKGASVSIAQPSVCVFCSSHHS